MRSVTLMSAWCIGGCIAGVGPSLAVKVGSGTGIHVGVDANFGVASTQDAAMQSTNFVGAGIAASHHLGFDGTSSNGGYAYGHWIHTLSPIVTDGGSAVGTVSVVAGVAVSRSAMTALRTWRPTDRTLAEVASSEIAAGQARDHCAATRSALFEKARQAKTPDERRAILTRSVGSTTFSNVPRCDVPGSPDVEDGKLLVTTDQRAFDLLEARTANDRLVGKVIHVWTIEPSPVPASGAADVADVASLAGGKAMGDTGGRAPTEIATAAGWKEELTEEPTIALDRDTIRYARANVVSSYDGSTPQFGPLIGVSTGYLGGIDPGIYGDGCGVRATASIEVGLRWRGDGVELYLTPKANLVSVKDCPLVIDRVAPRVR